MRRLSGNLFFFATWLFKTTVSSFFSTDRRSSSWGRGEDTTIWGMYFFSLLTKITSFRHIPSTEKCVETDYNIYYSDREKVDSLLCVFARAKRNYGLARSDDWWYERRRTLLCPDGASHVDGECAENHRSVETGQDHIQRSRGTRSHHTSDQRPRQIRRGM